MHPHSKTHAKTEPARTIAFCLVPLAMTTQFSVLRTDGTGATTAFARLASFRTGPSAVCRWTRGLGRRSTFRVGLARVDGHRWTISDEYTPGVFRERLSILAKVLQRRLKQAGTKAPSLASVLGPLQQVQRARVQFADDAPPALRALAAGAWVPSQRTARQEEILQALRLAERVELGTTIASRLASKKARRRGKLPPPPPVSGA